MLSVRHNFDDDVVF